MALHSDGSISHIPLSLAMVPDFAENATYEQDFVRQKVIHDRDRIFAGIVLGDMYGKNDTAAGSGAVNMRANLTSMAMPDIYRMIARDPLDLPLNLVYEQPSPYNVTITADGRRASFIERGFEFDTNWKYIVNMDDNNLLNATQYRDLVTINPDKNFGPYENIFLNGKMQNVTCADGCTIFLPASGANSTIVAYNIWQGRASRTFGPYPDFTKNPLHYAMPPDILALILAVIAFGIARRYWGSFASALGLGRN